MDPCIAIRYISEEDMLIAQDGVIRMIIITIPPEYLPWSPYNFAGAMDGVFRGG
jgi:hypothetical protein